jgi:serine/threonine-protein kinase
MTPECASPEQVRGEPPTTASDVYQLGYLLYCLLTGRAPYSADRRNVAAMVHAICNIEPARASNAVTSTPGPGDVEAVREASIARATAPERLRRRLSGDLDNILRTALCKHPERRYPSVVHLCEDLRRHLQGLPVSARPPTLRYRGGKFVRRHRAGVLATALVSLAIVSGIAATAWQARATAREAARAEQQAEIATAVIDYLNKDMIAAANPAASNAADVTVAEVLDAAAASADERFAGRPRVEAAIRLTLGEAYLGLGNLEAAESELAAALALLEADGGGSGAEAIRARLHLSDVLMFEGRFDGARGLLDTVLRVVTLDDDAQTWFHARGRQAGLMRMQGDAPGSLQRLEELLPLATAELGAGHETTQEIQEMLGGALSVSGRSEEAIEVFAAALEAAVDRFGEGHVAALRPRMNLANALRKAGRLEEAIAPMETGLEGYKAVLGDEHVQTLWATHMTALLYADLRRYDEAADMFRRAAEGRARLWGADHPATLASRAELDRVSRAAGETTAESSN